MRRPPSLPARLLSLWLSVYLFSYLFLSKKTTTIIVTAAGNYNCDLVKKNSVKGLKDLRKQFSKKDSEDFTYFKETREKSGIKPR